ncbi:MAG: Gfo/Idh/MocA family oxidoreductase [Candidatus Thermoplasmatota archaeon]|nr:Gfo/Idh/MocA family oxidoreductase [Candidatus Thermoplasmatota archaeon]
MKLAVIGTGYWGKNHVRALKEMLDEGKIEELYVCDIDEKRAEEMASSFGIPYSLDYKELIHSSIDGVVIATPSDTHYELAKEFLEAGKDVLVEKPMTLDSKDADELIKIAEKNDRILSVGHIFRYHSAVNEIRNKITRGDFGEIYYMMSNRYSLGYPRQDMGVLFALGIHEVDLFCYLLNKEYPEEIFATLGNYIGKTEEIAQIITYFENNVKGYAFESWLSPNGKRRELVVVGSKMSAFVDYLKPNEIKIFDVVISPQGISNEGFYVIPIEYKEPLKEELKDFINCIKTRKQPIADMHTGKRAVEMIEKAITSAKEGKKIKFE